MLVNSIFHFPRHMTFFTTADLLEIGGLPFVTPYEKPTQVEGLKYYRARHRDLRPARHPRRGGRRARPRRGRTFVRDESRRADGAARTRTRARTWSSPPATTTIPTSSACRARTCPTSPTTTRSRTRSSASDVVVVGGKNSAAIAALELYRAGARVTLVHRGARAVAARSSTGSSPTSRTASRRARSPARLRTRACARSARARVVVNGPGWGRRSCPPTRSSCSPATTPTRACCEAVGVARRPRDAGPRARPGDAGDQRAGRLPRGRASPPAATRAASSSRTASSTAQPIVKAITEGRTAAPREGGGPPPDRPASRDGGRTPRPRRAGGPRPGRTR